MRIGIIVASLHVCGSVPVAQLWLKISSSLQVALLTRWVSISFVIASGPGDFFAFSCLSAAYSSFNVSFLSMHLFVVWRFLFPLLPSCFTLVLLGEWDVAYFFNNCQQICLQLVCLIGAVHLLTVLLWLCRYIHR